MRDAHHILRQKHRARRIAWAGFVLAWLVACVWSYDVCYDVGGTDGRHSADGLTLTLDTISIEDGDVVVSHLTYFKPFPFEGDLDRFAKSHLYSQRQGPRAAGAPDVGFTLPAFRRGTWPTGQAPRMAWVGIGLPLWIVILLGAIIFLFGVWRLRMPPPNACLRCRYDLTGNTSGRCPECGLSVVPETERGKLDRAWANWKRRIKALPILILAAAPFGAALLLYVLYLWVPYEPMDYVKGYLAGVVLMLPLTFLLAAVLPLYRRSRRTGDARPALRTPRPGRSGAEVAATRADEM